MSQSWSQDVFTKAWNFATKAHQGQTYGGSDQNQRVDYLNHIGSVAMEVIWALASNSHLDGNLAIQCALLHDVIEDTKHVYEDLLEEFGKNVADGVSALTKNEALPTKQEQMADSLARIKKQPVEVWMVKMSDRITNLYAPPFYWANDKKIAYREEALVIYKELHESSDVLANRLSEKIESYKGYLE